ncbi:MAG: helix-turn-helix transcriptional regulator [Bacteroidota bacterium]|nr:helix-turn-helix transcriptional regulator [Bacteroidota bacterium]
MLKLKIKEVLLSQGKKNPQAWLQKHCNITKAKCYNLIHHKQKSIAFEDLSKICKELNCTPNDLFWWDTTKKTVLPVWHDCITKLSKPTKDENWTARIEGLDLAQVEELKKTMERFEKERLERLMKIQNENENIVAT